MKDNTFIPNEKTKKFIRRVKTLKESGEIKKHEEIVKAIKWHKTSMSNVMNGRDNIPDYLYAEFVKVYGAEVNDPENVSIGTLFAIDIKCDVIISTIAEILANQRGGAVEKIKTDLVGMVNQRVSEKADKI